MLGAACGSLSAGLVIGELITMKSINTIVIAGLLTGCVSTQVTDQKPIYVEQTFYCVEGRNRVTGTYTTQRANEYGRVIYGTRYKINNRAWLTAHKLVIFGGYCAFGVAPDRR